MRILARLQEFLIGSPESIVRIPPGLSSFELMAIGLRELAQSHAVTGCSASEIAEIELEFSLTLPRTYRVFLEAVGRNAGPFLRGSDYYYPRIFEMRNSADELLVESGESFRLQPHDFVFFMHQGYQFAYFPTLPAGDDPLVYYYEEGKGEPSQDAVSFTEWMVNELQQADDGPPPRKRCLT